MLGSARRLNRKEDGHDDSKRGIRARQPVTRCGNTGALPTCGVGATDMRDTVQIHVTADLPIRVRALVYANRAEIRFGKAFPVVLLVDSDAIAVLSRELEEVRAVLNSTAAQVDSGDETPEVTD